MLVKQVGKAIRKFLRERNLLVLFDLRQHLQEVGRVFEVAFVADDRVVQHVRANRREGDTVAELVDGIDEQVLILECVVRADVLHLHRTDGGANTQ